MIVDCALYDQGRRVGGRLSVEEAAAGLAEHPSGFVWLGLRMPPPDELSRACAASGLKIDEHEALTPHRRPVVSREGEVTVLHLRTALYDDVSEQVSVGELTMLAGRQWLITIRHGNASPLSDARASLESDPDLLEEGLTAALVTSIRAVIDSYRPALDGFEKDAVEVEREVLSLSRVRPVRRLLNLSRQVRELHLAVEAMEDPLQQLVKHRHLSWTPETIDELRTAITLVQRVVARTESLAGLLASAHAANMAQVSSQQNEDMRRISAWVAIAAVPTMIAGIYGMNFEHMPELSTSWAYPVVLGLMVVVCLLLYRSFRKRGWL